LTKPEKIIGAMLEWIGFVVKPFQKQSSLDPSNCFYSQMFFESMRLDFALPTALIAIEVNGSYWHGSRTISLTKKQMMKQLDDSAKEQKLAQQGWKLLTIVDCDINRPHFKSTLQRRIWDMLDV